MRLDFPYPSRGMRSCPWNACPLYTNDLNLRILLRIDFTSVLFPVSLDETVVTPFFQRWAGCTILSIGKSKNFRLKIGSFWPQILLRRHF